MPDDRFATVRDIKNKQRKPSKKGELLLIAVLFLFVAGVAIEVFGHYAYVHVKGNVVTRIDRFTGDTCTMPCTQAKDSSAQVPAYASDASKTCHSSTIVRVSSAMRIPSTSRPYPYDAGGLDPQDPTVRKWSRHVVPDAVELTDGHIYLVSASSYVAVATWSTGDAVQVCATYSKIERRPFFSVRGAEGTEPADIAI